LTPFELAHAGGGRGAHTEGVDEWHATEASAFARNLLSALLRFKAGDFSSRMPAELTGLEGKIADVFQ